MYTAIDHSSIGGIGLSDQPSPREAEIVEYLNSFIAERRSEEPFVVGFPGNLDFSFGHLAGLLDIFVNNVGDPQMDDKSDVNAKGMERSAVEFMAQLSNGRPEHTYGYVASGGSEANLFGMDRGCTQLPAAKIYCSRSAHYSIRKNARLMRTELVVIDCDDRGRMDTEELRRACARESGRGAVVVATVGTTMTGAIDDVRAIVSAAAAAGTVYVHLDAALLGLIVPFTSAGQQWGFACPEVGSIAISMHKGLGMPVPCALALCRSEYAQSRILGEYVGATDSTLGCSRSGMASILIWYALAVKGVSGLAAAARASLDVARYAFDELNATNSTPMLEPDSIIVTFNRPEDWICRKYHLATEDDRAHLVGLPHVTREVIDQLCRDVMSSRQTLR